jgi:hypothetical protein
LLPQGETYPHSKEEREGVEGCIMSRSHSSDIPSNSAAVFHVTVGTSCVLSEGKTATWSALSLSDQFIVSASSTGCSDGSTVACWSHRVTTHGQVAAASCPEEADNKLRNVGIFEHLTINRTKLRPPGLCHVPRPHVD